MRINEILEAEEPKKDEKKEVAKCDVCDTRPGKRLIKAAGGTDTWVCNTCTGSPEDDEE